MKYKTSELLCKEIEKLDNENGRDEYNAYRNGAKER